MLKKLINRPQPFKGESLTGYLQRIAQENYISPHELWRLLMVEGTHYPQSNMAKVLDYVPGNILNLEKMSYYLNVGMERIISLTFQVALMKFYPNETTVSEFASSRILIGLTEPTRKFCPECLKGYPFYRLIWQVKEISYCQKHRIRLLSYCPNCNKKVGLLGVNSKVGQCSYCNFPLSNASDIHRKDLFSSEERSYQDWLFLLNINRPNIVENNACIKKGSLAAKMLYVACNCSDVFNREKLNRSGLSKSTQGCLLQKARETWPGSRHIYVKNLLMIIKEKNLSLDGFINIKIPPSFLSTLLSEKKTIKEETSCIAPWCKSYKKPGSLKRTLTAVKSLADGRDLKYYLYCKDCGLKYAIDVATGSLVERGYFIELAWNKVRPLLLQAKTLSEMAECRTALWHRVKQQIKIPMKPGKTALNYSIQHNVIVKTAHSCRKI